MKIVSYLRVCCRDATKEQNINILNDFKKSYEKTGFKLPLKEMKDNAEN